MVYTGINLEQLGTKLTPMLSLLADGSFVMIGVFGLILWAFGKSRIKIALAIISMLAGAIAAGVVVSHLTLSSQPALLIMVCIIIGALAGVVLGLFLARLWTAILLAFVAAILAPLCIAAWHEPSVPMPDTAIAIEQTVNPLIEATINTDITGDGEIDQRSVRDVVIDMLKQTTDQWKQWWLDLGKTTRWATISVSTVAAIVGFIVGLTIPNLSAIAVSAIIGSFMILTAIGGLMRHIGPEGAGSLFNSPRRTLIALVVTAAAGIMFQWIILRRSADK